MSPEETDYEEPEEGGADQHNGDPTQMALRGQMESFLNTFQQSDEPTASHYLEILAQWLQDPGMLELVSENSNPLVETSSATCSRYVEEWTLPDSRSTSSW